MRNLGIRTGGHLSSETQAYFSQQSANFQRPNSRD